MAETKKRDDLKTEEVEAKAKVAVRWCEHASDYAAAVGGKPWKYLLIPHDEIIEPKKLQDFLRFELREEAPFFPDQSDRNQQS